MGVDVPLTLIFFAVALLYSSVGHAGASGYLAAMALFNVPTEQMRPAALTLNLFVAVIATIKYTRAGCFSWPLFWPFALAAVPLAFLAGHTVVAPMAFKMLVGAVLLFAAGRLLLAPTVTVDAEVHPPSRGVALACGAVLGTLAGLTGTGGGIFLSPLLVICRWATLRQAAGVSAAFILVNSLAGLLGFASRQGAEGGLLARVGATPSWSFWIPAVLLGGWLGAEWGSRRLPTPTLRRLLAAVLLLAAGKLLFAG